LELGVGYTTPLACSRALLDFPNHHNTNTMVSKISHEILRANQPL